MKLILAIYFIYLAVIDLVSREVFYFDLFLLFILSLYPLLNNTFLITPYLFLSTFWLAMELKYGNMPFGIIDLFYLSFIFFVLLGSNNVDHSYLVITSSFISLTLALSFKKGKVPYLFVLLPLGMLSIYILK